MTTAHLQFTLFLISLAGVALFAFIETTLTSLRPFQINELSVSAKNRYLRLFTMWQQTPQQLLISILIVNNLCSNVATVAFNEAMQSYLGSYGMLISVGLATILMIIFGDILPKTFAKSLHGSIINYFLWLIDFVVVLLAPFAKLLLIFSQYILKLFGGKELRVDDTPSEKEIMYLIEKSDEQGVIDNDRTEMLQNVFGLGSTTVNHVMKPRFDMVMIELNASPDQAMQAISHHRYSRIPVYEGKEDNIVGIIYHKDLFDLFLQKEGQKPLREIVRPVLFVPETKRINQLLNEFLQRRMHMAIVIDEFGTVVGLVTLEDVIEEIVGEISDEHEKIHTGITPLEQGGWLVDASVGIEKVATFLNVRFEVEDSLTLAGFLTEKLQHVPTVGEKLHYKGYSFKIQQANDKRIFQVIISHIAPPQVS